MAGWVERQAGRYGLALAALGALASPAALAQAAIDASGPTAAQIAARLEGPGLTITNADIPSANGSDDPAMYALFSSGVAGSNLAIDTGVAFSTGTVAEMFTSNDQIGATLGPPTTYTDTDLTSLEAGATRNVALVTMDITLDPYVTGIAFRYQFGSDEYPDYAGSTFNDLIAILISGPGISGKENIARAPGGGKTDINTINYGVRGCQGGSGSFDATNSAYYQNNGHITTISGSTGRLNCNPSPQPGPFPYVLEWNGLTAPLTASRTGLTPGSTYTLKIAIADVGDSAYDSGAVFELISGTYDRDYGDAPNTGGYGNPYHDITSPLRLGTGYTAEAAGYNDPSASGDSDDGVVMPVLQAGNTTTLNVRVTGSGGYLQAWFDWNDDGDFNDSGEQVATDAQDDNGDGWVQLAVTPPGSASTVSTIARFRWSATAGLNATGAAGDGEVEDYPVTINGSSTVYTCPAGYSVISKTGNAGTVVTAAQYSTYALGAILAANSTTNSANSARVTATLPTLTLRLGDIVPQGATLVFSVARDTNTSNMAIDTSPDGSTFTQVATFNTGTLDRTQRVSVTAGAGGVEYVRFRRLASNVWIDGVQYDFACLGASELQGSKTTAVYTGAGLGPLAIPGNDVTYTITIANTGVTATDTDSVVVIDAMPPEVTFFNGATPEFGGQVIGWSETGTGLSFTPATDVAYSNSGTRPANFAACTYSPVAGYDPSVTYVCFNPKGSMAAGEPDPEFSVSFRARIR